MEESSVRVLITAPGFNKVADIFRDVADVELVFDKMGRSYTEEELVSKASGYDGIIA